MEENAKRKSKIAVIEDQEILSKALVEVLVDAEFTVVTAFDGTAGLALIRKEKPDLLLLDLLIPKQDGFAVLAEVRKNPEWNLMPIIVLSNLGGDTEIKRALEMGADDYFVKSQHTLLEVLAKVEEQLRGERSTTIPKIGT